MAPSEPKKFFKVILSSTLHQGKMKIPKRFVKEQGGELSGIVRLCIPTGQNWNIGIERGSDNTVWFIDGVDKFLEDNSIGIGYILVFKYEGSSRFVVQIFDLTATEVEYTCMDDDSSVECLGSSTDEVFRRRCYFTRRRKQVIEASLPEAGEANGANVDDEKTNQYGKNSTMYEDTTRNDGLGKERIIDAENKSSKNFFKVTMAHRYLKKKFLRVPVPADFARLHMPLSKRFFKLVDGENNEWVVRYSRRGRHNNLGPGWGKFVRDKELMVGDVCMFELVLGDEEVKLRVTISRSDGKKSTMYKDTTRNNGSDASPGDIGEERLIEPENESSPNFFNVTMTSTYIEKNLLGVKSEFARMHMPHSTMFIKLVDSEDNEWAVRYIHQRHNNFLTLGWKHFVRDTKLMWGDVCLFERVWGDDEVKLRVTISRFGK